MDPTAQTPTTPEPVLNINQYADATPFVVQQKQRGGPSLVTWVVVFVTVVSIVVIVLFTATPPQNTTLNPPVSNPVSGAVSTPVNQTPQLNPANYDYASIAVDNTVRIYDRQGKELVIDLADRKWSKLRFSPNGEVLSVMMAEQGVNNLAFFKIKPQQWNIATVYTTQTGGITGYEWISNDNIRFTQDGWLHNYNFVSGEITKLVKLDMDLVKADIAKQRLLLRKIVKTEIEPAVITKVPDFSKPNPRPTDVVDKVVKEAVIKDNTFYTLTDLSGNKIIDISSGALLPNDKYYVLKDVIFTAQPDDVIAQLSVFNPENSTTSIDTTYYFYVNKAESIVFNPETDNAQKTLVLDVLSDGTYLFANLDTAGNIISLQKLQLNNLQTQLGEISFTQTNSAVLQGWQVIQDYKPTKSLIQLRYAIVDKGISKTIIRWHLLDETTGNTANVAFADNYLGLSHYQR